MIRLFPPVAKINLAQGTFTFQKSPGQAGSFRLSNGSLDTVASVNATTGEVTFLKAGTVQIDLVENSNVLASASLEILGNADVVNSHLTLYGVEVDFLATNQLAKDEEVVLYPQVIRSTNILDPSQGNLTEYDILLSNDGGTTYYSVFNGGTVNYQDYITQLRVARYTDFGLNLSGFRITCLQASVNDILVKLTKGTGLEQVYQFSLNGPASISYSPYYLPTGFEIDLGTSLSVSAGVLYHPASTPSEAALFVNQTPDILDVSPLGVVSPKRATYTDYPTYTKFKNNIWSFVKTEKNEIYATVKNEFYKFDKNTGFTQPSFYTGNVNFNFRQVSDVLGDQLITFATEKVDDAEGRPKIPNSIVTALTLSNNYMSTIAQASNEVATACAVVKKPQYPSSRFCLLSALTINLVNPQYSYEEFEQYGLTKLYIFPASQSNLALGTPSAQFAGIIQKILPGPDGWAYLQSNQGSIHLYHFDSGYIQQISLVHPAQTFSVSSDKKSFWVYSNVLDKVKLRKYNIEFATDNNSFYVDDNQDFGELNTKPESPFILRADLIDDIHYLIFSTVLPDNKYIADIFPNTQDAGNNINEYLGILDLSQDVIGKVRYYSGSDSSVHAVVDFKVWPEGTKRAYFLWYTGSVLNLPTNTNNLLPVTVGYSDGTFSYNTDISSQVGLTSSLIFDTGSKILYTSSSDETEGFITFKTSDNQALAKTVRTNFYHEPVEAGFGAPGNLINFVSVTTGVSISVPTFIKLANGNLSQRKLIITKTDTNTTFGWGSDSNLLITGQTPGYDIYSYVTPQQLPNPLSGTLVVAATGIPVPSYIRFTNIQNNAVTVDYRPAPFFKKYELFVSGETIYSDGSVRDDVINWSLASGSDVLEISGNKLTVKTGVTLPVSQELKGLLRATNSIDKSVQKTGTIFVQASDDTVITEIFFPDYITKYDNFVTFNALPQGTLPVYLRRSDNAFLYGNSLVTFTVSNNGGQDSIRHGTNGTFSTIGSLSSNNRVQVVYDRGSEFSPLTGTVTIQVGGPERIESTLPYYKVDAGSTLTYASGIIYDVNGDVFTGTLNKVSDNPYEFSGDPSGILRGQVVPYISGLSVPIKKACVTEENTLATLDDNGLITYYDTYLTAKVGQRVTFRDIAVTVFDLPWPDRGVAALTSFESVLFRMDKAATFSTWGSISGNILSLALVGDRVFYTRTLGVYPNGNPIYELGSLSKNSLPPAQGKTLDYAIAPITGITHPASVCRDGSKVLCTNTSGDVFVIYDDATRQSSLYQIFDKSKLASSSINITTGNLVQNIDLQTIGQLPNLSGIAAGYSFFLTDGTKKSVWRYTPSNVSQSTLSFYVTGYSTQTRTQIPVEVLPSGSKLDYFGTITASSNTVPYINDKFSVDLKIYNSDGSLSTGTAALARVDLYLNEKALTALTGSYTQGGSNVFRAVSKSNPDLQFTQTVEVRRRVSSITIDNFQENDVVSVNADSSVPLEAWVVYEDGYRDKRFTATVTTHADSVSTSLVGLDFFINGLSVTRQGAPASVTLTAAETEVQAGKIRTKTFSVQVWPAGTRKLSRLEVPSGLSFQEQSTQSAGVNLVFTDGFSTPLYDEGFQNSFDGVQTFSDLVDLTVADDIVYVLRKSSVDLYEGRGVILKSISFTQPLPQSGLSKIRVDGSDIYVSNSSIIYRLGVDGTLTQKYGSYEANNLSTIQDFLADSGILYVVKVDAGNSTTSTLVTKGDAETTETLLTNDIKRFVRLSNGKFYFLTTSSIVDQNNTALISGLANVNSIASFDNLIYLSTNHRIARIGLNGQITYIAGSVFSGFTNGSSVNSRFNIPTSLALDSRQRLFVLDSGNKTLRRMFESSVTTLIGGFWTSVDSNVAIGQGPIVIFKKPGVTTLSVTYLSVTKTIAIKSVPVYTSVQIDTSDAKLYIGSSTDKTSIDLKATVYSLSGPATGTPIALIDYPPTLQWQCNPYNYLSSDNTQFTLPDSPQAGTYEIKVIVSGTPSITNTAVIEVFPWEVVGIEFKSGSYFAPTYKAINFSDQIVKVYNDGVRTGALANEVTFTGTTQGSSLDPQKEYQGIVVATTVATPIYTAQASAYVYDKNLDFEFSTTPVTISVGYSRNLAGRHIITGTTNPPDSIFRDAFIEYSLSNDLSGFAVAYSNGIVSALEKTTTASGELSGTSLLLNKNQKRQVSTSTGAVWSEFVLDPSANLWNGLYILHTGSAVVKLEDIPVKAIDSQKNSIRIRLSKDNTQIFNVENVNAIIKTEQYLFGTAFGVEFQPRDVVSYSYKTGSDLFSLTYTHALDTVPLASEVKTFGIPFLSVTPLGIEIKHDTWYAINTYRDNIPVPTLFVVAGLSKQYSIKLVYNDSYLDLEYQIESSSAKYTVTRLQDGVYTISGNSIADPNKSWVDDDFYVVYNFDNQVKFPIRVVVSREPLVEAITFKETFYSVIVKSLVDFSTLTPEVRLTDLSFSNTGYEWWINDVQRSDLTGAIILDNLKDGDVIYARSKGVGFEGRFIYSPVITFYTSVNAATGAGASPPNNTATQQAIDENKRVEFVPKLDVQLDLEKTLPACIKSFSWVSSTQSNQDFLPNTDFMLDESKKAIFSRKITIQATGTGILASHGGTFIMSVGQNSNYRIIREPEKSLSLSITNGPSLAISLDGGYLVHHGSKLYAFNDEQTSAFESSLSPVLSLSWISGNAAIAADSSNPYNLKKIVVNFDTKAIDIEKLGPAPTGHAFTRVFTTPAGSLRYLDSTGIYINQNGSLTSKITKTIDAAMAISETQYVVSKDRKVWLVDDATNLEEYLGEIASSFGNILQIERGTTGYVLFRTDSHLLRVSTTNNQTKITIKHPDNKNITDSLNVTILPTGSKVPYLLTFVPEKVNVDIGKTFSVTGLEFNSDGSCTEVNSLVHDSSYLTLQDNSYLAIKHGTTIISGTSAALTGTVSVTIRPVVTGIEVSSDFFTNPVADTTFTAGAYLPYKIVGVLSDGSYTNKIKLDNDAIVYDTENYLIYAESSLNKTTVNVSSVENSSIKTGINITVLASGTVKATRMDIESGPFNLKINDKKFISGTVYYTNGTSDSYISTSFAGSTSPQPIDIIDTNILKAKDKGSTRIKIVPMVQDKLAGVSFEETRDVTSAEDYGIVETIKNGSNIITGFKIKNSSGLDDVYFDFSKIQPTVVQVEPATSYFDSIEVAVDRITGNLVLRPLKAYESKDVTLQVSLEGYTLTDSTFSIKVPAAVPQLKFENASYLLIPDSNTKTAINASLVYDSVTTTGVVLKSITSSEAIKSYISQDSTTKQWYFNFYSTLDPNVTFPIVGTITGTYSKFTATSTVDIEQGLPDGIAFFSNGNRISSVSTSPYYATEITGAIVDNTLTPLSSLGLTTTALALAPDNAGITITTGNQTPPASYSFTVQGSVSGNLTAAITVGGSPFTTSLAVIPTQTRVKSVSLTLGSNQSPGASPYKIFVDTPFSAQVQVRYAYTPATDALGFIVLGYRNLDFVTGPSDVFVTGPGGENEDVVGDRSFFDLFDIYLGDVLLDGSQILVTSVPSQPDFLSFTFLQSITAEPSPLYVKLKTTEITSSKLLTIILQENPYSLEITNSDLDKYRRVE